MSAARSALGTASSARMSLPSDAGPGRAHGVNLAPADTELESARRKLRAASYRFKGQDWGKLFRKCDLDHDTCLSWKEFVHALRNVAKISRVARQSPSSPV